MIMENRTNESSLSIKEQLTKDQIFELVSG